MNPSSKESVVVFSVLAALILTWAGFGWLDLPHQTQAGFNTNASHLVTHVYSGSAAEEAGLQRGDLITHFDGTPAEDSSTIARHARKIAGEERSFTLKRDDEVIGINIAYQSLTERQLKRKHTQFIIGFCFLLLPLWSLFKAPSEATRILSIMGFGLSLSFVAGPYIPDYSIRSMTVAISSLFVLMGVAALIHFLHVFPRRQALMDKRYGKSLLYWPMLILWLLIAYRVLFTPIGTSALNSLTNVLSSLIIGVYLLVGVFRVLRNFSQTDKAQRKALALNWMLLASILAVLPVTIAQLTYAFSPGSILPGQDFYFVSLVLIPFGWAWSASRTSLSD